jgi:rhodanese-related sulfurtransferase
MDLVKSTTIDFNTIQPFELCKYLSEHPDVVVLDVRTPEEFAGITKPDYGKIKNAINVPIKELENNPSIIDSLKGKEIIIYCSHSRRSPRASYILTQHGFKNITNLAGGMSVFTDIKCKQ